MKNWPHWIPRHELKADDLVGLEAFLIARSELVDGGAHGIDQFDWKRSLQVSRDGNEANLSVTNLRGVTPGGYPVVLDQAEILSCEMAGAEQGDTEFDVTVDVNDRSQPAKIALAARPVESDDHILPSALPDRLYLGRYRLSRGAESLELVHRPIVRRLSALTPLDASWREWLEPLAAQIRIHQVEARSARERSGLYATEVQRLTLDGYATTVVDLAPRLRRIRWLRGASRDDEPPQELFSPSGAFPPAQADGDSLPAYLADLLMPKSERSLSEVLDVLLRPVEFRVPSCELEDWIACLSRIHSRAIHGMPGNEVMRDEVNDALRRWPQSESGVDDWTQAIGLLSVLAFVRDTANVWNIVESDSFIARSGDPVTAACDALDRLCRQDARDRPALPFGVWWLAKAAALYPSVVQQGGPALQSYFESSRLPTAGGRDDSPALTYLSKRVHGRSAVPTEELKLPASSRPQGERDAITIAVIGPPHSGKTSLVDELTGDVGTSTRVPGGEVQFTSAELPLLSPPSSSDTDVDPRVIRGEFVADGKVYPLRLLDFPGRAFERKDVLSQASDVDLLILTTDAASAIAPKMARDIKGVFVDQIAETIRKNPHAMVALAYTKADEYGTMDPRGTRLFGDNVHQALSRRQIEQSLQKMSQHTPASGAYTSKSEQKVGGAIIGKPMHVEKRTDEPWEATRRRVIANTEGLWLEIQQAGKIPGFIDGYFVAADPREPYLEPSSSRGFQALFGDFFRYFLGGK